MPARSRRIYIYSDDLGKSWTELPGLRQVPGVEKWTFPGPPHLAHAKSITFHPKDPNIIHVAVEVGGFLRSTDGGKTWTTIDNINPDAHRVLVPANDPSETLRHCADDQLRPGSSRQVFA